jgi:hypothetical protein
MRYHIPQESRIESFFNILEDLLAEATEVPCYYHDRIWNIHTTLTRFRPHHTLTQCNAYRYFCQLLDKYRSLQRGQPTMTQAFVIPQHQAPVF